jgi:hypothetical protein
MFAMAGRARHSNTAAARIRQTASLARKRLDFAFCRTHSVALAKGFDRHSLTMYDARRRSRAGGSAPRPRHEDPTRELVFTPS